MELPCYNLSEYLYFYKMKTYKISCRKVKISISPGRGHFQLSAPGERYVYLKKNSPWGEFHLAYVQHASKEDQKVMKIICYVNVH